MRLDDELAEAQADAAAARLGAVAEIEDRRDSFGRDSGAGVREAQRYLAAVAFAADTDRPAVRLRLDGVAQQIVERLAQPVRITVDRPRPGRQIGVDRDSLRGALRHDRFETRLQCFREIE